MATPRRNELPIKVYCLQHERRDLEHSAKTAGLSLSAYLRHVGLGAVVHSVCDLEAVRDLAKINADLGRLGGLLKALMTNDERFDGYDGNSLLHVTKSTLLDIQAAQAALRGCVMRIEHHANF